MRLLLSIILGLCVGVSAAFYTTSEDAPAVVRKPFTHEAKMPVYGFQPFWLLTLADNNYASYTGTFIYFGLQINEDGTLRKMNNEQEEEPGWTNLKTNRVRTMLSDLRSKNIPISLAVQNANEEQILTLLEDPETTAKALVEELEPIVKEYQFDDVNLDIESFTTATPETQAAFVTFVKTVREEMKARTMGTLSIDVTPMSLVRPRLTSVSDIEPFVDTIILMTYDYHYIGSYIAGPVAPVNGAGDVREYDVKTALIETLKYVPREKVILGIPTYGYEWDTLSKEKGAATIPGTGKTASARRIMETTTTCWNCTKAYDDIALEPYVIKPENDYYRQFYYEDKTALQEKIKLAKAFGIHGIAVWAYGYETADMRDELSILQ